VGRVLKPDYPIETERLLLRPLDPTADVDALHAYQSREDVCRYIPYPPLRREQVAQRLADPKRTTSTIEEPGQFADLAVVVRDTGQVIGDVLLIYVSAEHRTAEIGYAFNPDHYGQGYATESCQALLRLAFEDMDLHRVTARIDQRNDASAAVLRRLGLRQEAVLIENEWFKGEWTTEVDFAILGAEWRQRVGLPARAPTPGGSG
jgi:RimJ/RimL family protein N-acetyltransferase